MSRPLILALVAALFGAPAGATTKFPLDFQRPINLKAISRDGVALGYESFGVTKLQLLAKASDDPSKHAAASVLVRHTVDGKSSTTSHSAQAAANAGWIKYEMTFETAGVHEILLSPRFTEVSARCLKGCGRPEISLADVLREMNDDELVVFVGQLESTLKDRLSESEPAKAFLSRLKQRLLARDPELGRRFPVLPPLAQVSGWRRMV